MSPGKKKKKIHHIVWDVFMIASNWCGALLVNRCRKYTKQSREISFLLISFHAVHILCQQSWADWKVCPRKSPWSESTKEPRKLKLSLLFFFFFLKIGGCYQFNARLSLKLISSRHRFQLLRPSGVFSFVLLSKKKKSLLKVGLSVQVQLKVLAWKVRVLRWPVRPSHNLFSYWTTTERGWHWNTPSTVSPAVHVKKPGIRAIIHHAWHFAALILCGSVEGFVSLWHTFKKESIFLLKHF